MPSKILITGATGYIGGRLAPKLLSLGHEVRCLARDPSRLSGRPWSSQAQLVKADLLDPESLRQAFSGIELAYYLVHSLAGGKDFHRLDLEAARNFAESAAAAPSSVQQFAVKQCMPRATWGNSSARPHSEPAGRW